MKRAETAIVAIGVALVALIINVEIDHRKHRTTPVCINSELKGN